MSGTHALFEVSFEVCNRVGGVHTVVSSRARSRVERYGDAFVCVGPWLLAAPPQAFEDDPAEQPFAEACRAAGLPVRVGRWLVPGRPRTLLVEFSGLIPGKDQVLAGLWDRHRVDSLGAGWDYVEPVLFGHAAGRVIERWWRERSVFRLSSGVVHVHEWASAAALLHLSQAVPELGTVFQAHSMVLGNALAARGQEPLLGLQGRPPDEVAAELGVRAPHSLEGVAARTADVFTTVSEMAADEGALFHGRRPEPLLPNVLDVAALTAGARAVPREAARRTVREVLSRLLGEDVREALLVVSAGRYDLQVKGFDVLVDALGQVNRSPGRPVVALLVVPVPNAGLRQDVRARLAAPLPPPGTSRGALPGFATHALFEPEGDALARRAREAGLGDAGAAGRARVRLVHVPVYLDGADELFGVPYASVLQAADLTCYPSAYDAWGFTPQESLALGVPTVTTDMAGFGRYVKGQGLGPADGVTVLARRGRSAAEAAAELARVLEAAAASPPRGEEVERRCREASGGIAEAELVRARGQAFTRALEASAQRARTGAPSAGAARAELVPVPPAEGRAARQPRLLPLDVPTRVPGPLRGLEVLARNWRWAWHAPTRALFERLAPGAGRGNPYRMLREAAPERLAALAADEAYVQEVAAAVRAHEAWLSAPPAGGAGPVPADRPVAYLCAEFALHASLPIYSGGLGVLAGDHLRAASDLGLPLVAVGLLYRRGYFRQRLEGGVEQVALEDPVDPARLPLERLEGADGRPLAVSLALPGGALTLHAWRASVGRVTLLLLDADHEGNRPEERAVTHTLYGGDAEMRLRQELVLGRGGVRLLDRLGLAPSVLHVNEGHGAFAALERIALLVREAGLTFDEARELVRLTTVFTTHTPVPAGHDRFQEDLLRRYLSDAPTWLGISWERLLSLGADPERPREFNMTHLAASLAAFVNGVSRKHGEVSRALLRPLAPGLLTAEMPVTSITNGVHLGEWTAPEVAALVGAGRDGPVGADFARAGALPLPAVGAARAALKARLLRGLTAHLAERMAAQSDPSWLVQQTLAGVREDALWVGFARRFATYKRAELLLRDPDRLRALLERSDPALRIVMAGKAHPRDREGAERIGRIARLARSRLFAGRVFLLEGYDLELARLLVQGCDVWLNTPRPPHEASGTSGMKAAANGGLNLSIADGWWIEGADGGNGWTIGGPEGPGEPEARDRADAEALYRLLEDEVLPLWAQRDAEGLRRPWLERVRRALATLPPVFDAVRMVAEYRDRAYGPMARRRLALEADGHQRLKALAAERRRVRDAFPGVRVVRAAVGAPDRLAVGDALRVEAVVALGALAPADVHVELVLGRRAGDAPTDLHDPVLVALAPDAERGPEGWRFRGEAPLAQPGAYGYGVRVRPRAADPSTSPLHDPVVWG